MSIIFYQSEALLKYCLPAMVVSLGRISLVEQFASNHLKCWLPLYNGLSPKLFTTFWANSLLDCEVFYNLMEMDFDKLAFAPFAICQQQMLAAAAEDFYDAIGCNHSCEDKQNRVL